MQGAKRHRHQRYFRRPLAGLDQGDTACRVFREPGGDHRAGGTAADHNKIECFWHVMSPYTAA
jgi:hypothetical protein